MFNKLKTEYKDGVNKEMSDLRHTGMVKFPENTVVSRNNHKFMWFVNLVARVRFLALARS